MFSILAAVAFLLALIQELAVVSWGVLTPPVLVTVGLLCLALHLVDWSSFRVRR